MYRHRHHIGCRRHRISADIVRNHYISANDHITACAIRKTGYQVDVGPGIVGDANVIVPRDFRKDSPFSTFKTDGTPLATSRSFHDFTQVAVSSRPDGKEIAYTLECIAVAPAGVNPAKTNYVVTAWLAADFSQEWRNEFGVPGNFECIKGLSLTSDGKWLIFDEYAGDAAKKARKIIDTSSGQMRETTRNLHPAGSFLVDIHESDPRVEIIDPDSLAPTTTDTQNSEAAFYLKQNPVRRSWAGQSGHFWDAFSSDGSKFAYPSGTDRVDLVDIKTLGIVRTFEMPEGASTRTGYLNSNAPIVVDDATSTLLVFGHKTVAFALDTGAILWTADAEVIPCAVANTQVNGIANGQMVLLDETNGTQIAYVTDPDFTNEQGPRCGYTYGIYQYRHGAVYRLVD